MLFRPFQYEDIAMAQVWGPPWNLFMGPETSLSMKEAIIPFSATQISCSEMLFAVFLLCENTVIPIRNNIKSVQWLK